MECLAPTPEPGAVGAGADPELVFIAGQGGDDGFGELGVKELESLAVGEVEAGGRTEQNLAIEEREHGGDIPVGQLFGEELADAIAVVDEEAGGVGRDPQLRGANAFADNG